ncbi:MAG: ACT domain-containing protein [Thermoanaerobacteraceae bacterium]|uniref:ACT domain-containing protein n=1 Tax=Thermanaeromonas sp. C210 TaxID=2731925 RepID=UPI00155B9F53|nr:ACT domain-containing protein [Thermanaeromonas sp. C210]MBE3580031.1 ACT domain-containing protein [Thermoanaerobacteraceae bacterium]GFN22624.1 amino acid-binding protein [Thermanaeromonas sp. C210]
MKIKQLSVFLENKSGRLAAVTRLLASKGINIRALSIADTSDFGILRLIVNDPQAAYRTLREGGFTVSLTEVLGVEMPDRPGGLSSVLTHLEEAGINIEYLYAFLGKGENGALVIFRVEDLDKAIEILSAKGVKLVSAENVYAL